MNKSKFLVVLAWGVLLYFLSSFLLGQAVVSTSSEEKNDNVEMLQLPQQQQQQQQQQQSVEKATTSLVNSTEWRELGVNETSVPRGSHVRLDFATGKRFLKIVNDTSMVSSHKTKEEEATETAAAADRIFTILSEVSDSDTRDEKLLTQIEMLRKLRRENRTVEFESQLNQVWNERQSFLVGFQNETKKKMEEEELKNKDPVWIHLKKLNDSSNSNSNELEIIESLTILVDNVEDLKLAVEFEKLNGFTICYGYLFAESDLIKNRALHLFGSVVKNYAPLQESLLKTKPALISQLLLLLERTQTEDRAFFALANLMRGNTFAHENDYAELYLEIVLEKFFTLLHKATKTKEETKLVKKMGDFLGDLLAENHVKINQQLVRSQRFCRTLSGDNNNNNTYLLEKVRSSMICKEQQKKEEI